MQAGDINILLSFLCLVLLVAAGVLAYFLIGRSEQIKEMRAAHTKLMRSFNDLDEQAKLIVKTDLELNKAQEELDKRLHGLNTLQKLSRTISSTLDEKEIFLKLNQSVISDLGFSRALILIFDESKVLKPRVNTGFDDPTLAAVLSHLEKDDHFKTALKDGHTFSSINTSKSTKEKIIQAFGVEHFILTPILTQNKIIGILFVGNRYNAPAVTEGDEELISILANQIGQALENTQLFEQVFRSSQMLESKVKERTKQLASALDKVNLISKQKSEFISAVSHELRTPLTSIKGYAAILIAGKIGEVPDAVKERLAKINLHSDNLVKMINDLLDIARIESGKVEMKFKKMRLKSIADNIADLLAPQLRDKEIKLVASIPESIPEVYVDSSQTERIFINLINNAIKFTPKKGTITIEAKPEVEDDMLTVSVSDTGIGMKPEDLQRLFQEFFRVDNDINQVVKGTGLGLSLVKNIVEAHRGRIWVTSKVNEGTTFFFTLPVSEKVFAAAPKKDDTET